MTDKLGLTTRGPQGEQFAMAGVLESTPGYWLTPPDLLHMLTERFGPFDYDPTMWPRPQYWEALGVPWGTRNFVNPPFRGTPGPTAFARKAILEHRAGRSSLLLLPVQSYVNLLLEAGAIAHPLGRVRWLHVTTGEPQPNPSPICAFELSGA